MNHLIYNSENFKANCQVIFSKLKLSYTQVIQLYLCSWNFKFEEIFCKQTDTHHHAPCAVLAHIREGRHSPTQLAPELLSD